MSVEQAVGRPPRAAAKGSPSWKAACAAFLRSLGQSAKVVSLYKISHPAAVTAVGATFKCFEAALEEAGGDRLTLALMEDLWLVNRTVLGPASQGPEILQSVFRNHGLASLVFMRGAGLYEFSALCELFKDSPADGTDDAFREHLLQRGIRHVVAEKPEYEVRNETPARIEAPPEPPAAPPPAGPEFPPAPPAAAPAEGRGAPQNRAFGSLLKDLVEAAVQDPDQRAHVYSQAFEMVKQALDRHVAESTKALRTEKERILKEQGRVESVLSAVAAGKVVVDKEGNVLMMNPAAEQITGKRLSQVAGRPIDEAIKTSEQMMALSGDLEIQDERDLTREVRVSGEQEVGRALKNSMAVIHDESGRVVGTYSSLPDVAKFQEAQKAQEDFVSRVTHDLKAPLTSICCALELISERLGPKLGAAEANYLGICLRNSQRLGDMIAKILDFSKLESGKLSVAPEPQEAGPILAEAVEGLKPWAQRRGLTLTAAVVEPGLVIRADRLRVIEILANLISNAIKSTAKGGKISVSAAAGHGLREGKALFRVCDTGCGIRPADLERVFEKFVQLDAQAGRGEGVGLGLTIVRELVALHGGEVLVESQIGRGSTFSFTIPLAE
jgi:PAS domain S-box-containing protein